jgi:hypothetical protein
MYGDDKKNAAIGTFENLRLFILNLMKVVPVESQTATPAFSLYASGGYNNIPVTRETTDGHTDFYVTVYPRPFAGYSTIANAGSIWSASWAHGRPVQGYIQLNMEYCPTTVADVKGEYFRTLFHELSHALGISSNQFRSWVNSSTGLPYNSSSLMYTIPAGPSHPNKAFQILHTPKIHEVLSERWGYENFDDNPQWPVGVEIEDTGGAGTIGSHWEGRTHFTDYMIGTSFGNSLISKLSLAAFEDMGWYSVNMGMAEPTAWGDWKSINGANASDFRNFALGAPALSWPSHYVPRTLNEMNSMVCTFDHRGTFESQIFGRRNCLSNGGECDFPEFYDATNIGYYGFEGLDYALIAIPVRDCMLSAGKRRMCAAGTLNSYQNQYRGACYAMDCEDDGTLRIWVGSDGASVSCTARDETKNLTGYTGYIKCPDPNIICGLFRFEKAHLMPTPDPAGASSNTLAIAVTVAAVVVVVVVVVVGIIIWCRLPRQRDSSSKSDYPPP